MKKIEIFQVIVGIFISISTAALGWMTYQLNSTAQVNNSELKRIEQTLSESKFGFERIRDVYDRTEKFLASENQNAKRGRALIVLISSLPRSELQSDLLSLMTIESKDESVAAKAADTNVLINSNNSEIGQDPDLDSRSFFGNPTFFLSDDGYSFVVAENFGYKDSKGVIWEVPKGFISDGASIPRAFWSVIGSPFSGKYRVAAVLHDYYVNDKTRPYEDVNSMFYESMIQSGVSKTNASILYSAVKISGPKWITRSD